MPKGKVLDPRINIIEGQHPESGFKDFGFLTESDTGHIVMYVKDKNSKSLSHGSPVEYQQVKLDLEIKGQPVTIEMAFITDTTVTEDYPAVKRTNAAVENYLAEEEWTGAVKRLSEDLSSVCAGEIKIRG